MFVITGWDFVFSSHCCLKRSEEVKVNGQIRETPHISIWGELFILSWKKNNTTVAKLQIPRGRVEWPAKSNFSVCVFTRVALAGENVLCQRLAVLSVMEVQWPIMWWCGMCCSGVAGTVMAKCFKLLVVMLRFTYLSLALVWATRV